VKHTFTLPGLKPFSINAAYVRTHSGVHKSQGASQFCSQIFHILGREVNQAKLTELREHFNVDKHVWICNMTAFYPHTEYFNKKGHISSKTIDCTNWEKLIVDAIWLPKFHNESFPQGCPNLNSDDRFLVYMSSHKQPAEQRSIEVTIEIIDKPTYPV
jgi:hypothetical protein